MAGRPTQYQKLSLQLDAENQKLKAKLKKTRGQIGGLTGAAKKLGGAFAAAFAVNKLVDFGKEASKMAAQFEGVSAAFRKMGGDQYLGAMKEATRGTVNNLELMRAAVQAKNFDIPMKSLASLFEFATKRSQQTGESVDYLVKSIILGIGRKSPLILDNLGISAIRLRKELKGAGTEAATVADVAEAVGRIASTEMKKAGDIINTTAIRTASWSATMDNLKVSIGTELNKGLNALAPLMDKIIGGAIKGFNWLKQGVRDTINEFITLYNESTAFRIVVEGIGFAFKVAWAKIKTTVMAIWELMKTTKNVILAAFDPTRSVGEEIQKGWDNIKNLYSNLGEDVIDAFKTAQKNVLEKEPLPLLPTEDQREPLFEQAANLGAEIARKVKEGVLSENISDSLMIQEMENQELQDQIDLENELADVNTKRLQTEGKENKKLGDQLKEIQASNIKGFIAQGIAAVIKQALAFIPPPFNLVAAGTAAAAATALFSKLIPSFAVGTDYVPRDMIAQIHKGERIVPAAQNRGGGHVTFEIRGDRLFGVLDEYNRRRSASF